MWFLEFILKITLLLGAAWIGVLLLRRNSAAVRHQAWSAALLTVMALPVFMTALPAWRVPVVQSLLPNGFVWKIEAQAAAGLTSTARAVTNRATVPVDPAERWLVSGSVLLLAMWSLGTAVSLIPVVLGWLAVRRLRRTANPITAPDLAQLQNLLSIDGVVELRETPAGSMPITSGLFNPFVLLPADAASWSASRRRVVLLHELAHVRRRDSVSQLFARLCVALYWWHPLVWKAWRECLKEQERAADDMVLNAGESATDYATHLLEIARSLQSPGALASAAVAMARPSQLEGRLSAMLDANRNRQSPQRASAVAASLSAMALLIPVAVLHAQSDTQQQSFETKTNVSAAARAFIDSGKIALSNRDYTKAAGDFEHAAAADAKVTSEADMWAAVTQQRQSNLTAAEGLYQSALAAEAPNSPFAATIMDLYAALLREENRADDAEAMTKRAAGVRSPIAVVEPLAPGVYRIGGNVVSPVLLSKAEPQYSEDARLAKYSGTALLSVEIGTDGAPHNVKIIRGLGLGLDEKAIAAVNRWKFKPGTLNGEPVATRAQIEINFRLL